MEKYTLENWHVPENGTISKEKVLSSNYHVSRGKLFVFGGVVFPYYN